MKPATQKCAIYTRKSTERGLEQEFNTLDAQREACLAYITSQKSEGWTPVHHLYDDGGYSGGSMDRPALNLLLEDIRAGKINIVVVYKIDRLTRSLTDFAKLVEVFDRHGVSFVSVTQSFNTTTSMGRLTLNVLLSFAQFEREVIGERIRDKVAASKKKGMWMGGHPMLGYDIVERQLIVNKKEAETIRSIFAGYLEFKTVARLQAHLKAQGVTSKSWVSRSGRKHTGQPYGCGALHHLLCNPVYAGCVGHKGEIYHGQHEAIIPRVQWQQVQDMLQGKAPTDRGQKKQILGDILKGKLFDSDGVRYTPMRANKKGKQYRYYVSQKIVKGRDHKSSAPARLPAQEIETLVLDAMTAEMEDVAKLATLLDMNEESDCIMLERVSQGAASILNIHTALHRVTIGSESLTIEISVKNLLERINDIVRLDVPAEDDGRMHRLIIPYHKKQAHKGTVVIRPGNGTDPLDLPKSRLESLVKGTIWRDAHFAGKSFVEIAREHQCSRSYVIQLIDKSLDIR